MARCRTPRCQSTRAPGRRFCVPCVLRLARIREEFEREERRGKWGRYNGADPFEK